VSAAVTVNSSTENGYHLNKFPGTKCVRKHSGLRGNETVNMLKYDPDNIHITVECYFMTVMLFWQVYSVQY
jgi:hypothetical protein